MDNSFEKEGRMRMFVDTMVLANYTLWRVVQQSLPLLSEEWREMEYDPSKILTENRYEECLASIRDNMGIALSAYYVQNYKSIIKERKDAAEMYKNYVHQEYIDIKNNVDWTFDRARERFKAKLTLNSTSYFLNTLSIRKWSTDYSFSLAGKPNVKGDWKKYSKATVPQTFYHVKDNSIEIPAGILNLPIFSSSRPRYLNFGSLGFTIAHALAHALDDKGN
ncbi:Membrane metallo-endopeptidase-like 1, partial [Stegodyphus mimosarum]